MNIDPRFRFENYVVGAANRLAVAAARAVAQSPGSAYNPLFMYSSSGLGKTHLMLAIGNLAKQQQHDLHVMFTSLDEFVDGLHEAVSAGRMDTFKERYYTVDMLLLDDVQFIAGRRETQNELMRLFNVLQRSGKQIVLTSDRPPAEIADLDERLITRLSGGLIVDIGLPDYETRVAILRKKCEERGVTFGEGVIESLAKLEYTNVRELQGALNRMIAHQAITDEPIRAEQVIAVLGARHTPTPASLPAIARAASAATAAIVGHGPMPVGTPPSVPASPPTVGAPPPTGTAHGNGGAKPPTSPPVTTARHNEFAIETDEIEIIPITEEFDSFVSDLASAVAQNIEPWRMRIGEAVTFWMELGFKTTELERALELPSDPGVDQLLAGFQRKIDQLQELGAEARKVDPVTASSELFFDPERIDEAREVVENLINGLEPPPAPDPQFTRATYEVSAANQFAVHASDAVIEEPGKRYNPLFLHGPAGTGKTHLLHAIGNELASLSGGAARVAVIDVREFANDLITAIQQGSIERFRARYRGVDALLLDNVQVCDGTERTQEELFHVFNAVFDQGKQIILSSDREPKALTNLAERLRSRFEGGLVVELQPADRMLREKLYARYLDAAGVRADAQLVSYLADTSTFDAPSIRAMVQRLVTVAVQQSRPLTLGLARREIEGVTPSTAAEGLVAARKGDPLFISDEKILWEWQDVAGRAIEDLR
ncbi:MAG TPA: DnaA/Hda family protein [Gemmatimonadaceae bacterium]|nr:DnaA/Hda family protein [Gemmatimonadaceae bacterium]